ncbi:MAG: SNF2-related protein, partial [Acidobacteriota bacterium]
ARRRSVPVAPELLDIVMPSLLGTGRFGWLPADDGECTPLLDDRDPPWQLILRGVDQGSHVRLSAELERIAARDSRDEADAEPDDTAPIETRSLATVRIAYVNGWLVFDDRVGRLTDPKTHFPWLAMLRSEKPLDLPRDLIDQAMTEMAEVPGLPTVRLPNSLAWPIVTGVPEPYLECQIKGGRCLAMPRFAYEDRRLHPNDPSESWADETRRRLVRRDRDAEIEQLAQLYGWLGHGDLPTAGGEIELPLDRFADLVTRLHETGWRVEAEGRSVRSSGGFTARVSSGIDWFDLAGTMDFGEQSAELPALLDASRRANGFVQLDDGSVGLLPKAWLERFAPLRHLGTASTRDDTGSIRFERHQALVLDALLAAAPAVEIDTRFAEIRQRLHAFDGLEPDPGPETFQGTLRPYQELGLAWMGWLAELGLGGCLADDMGLGKTIQVLAYLEQRRLARAETTPPRDAARTSLLVVPRSLLHNWIEEARRFTPELSIHLHHGADRRKRWPDEPSDVVL